MEQKIKKLYTSNVKFKRKQKDIHLTTLCVKTQINRTCQLVHTVFLQNSIWQYTSCPPKNIKLSFHSCVIEKSGNK